MEIVATFVPNLFAFHFPKKEFDALESTFNDWENPLFIFDFFTENEIDLKGKYTIEEAIEITRVQVKNFRKRMLHLASLKPNKLNEFFSNLNNQEYRQTLLSQQKAKQIWLRLYSLKIEDDENTFYAITGGMIKLTLLMEERPHGKDEKTNLNRCRDFLIEKGVYDADSFFEIFF